MTTVNYRGEKMLEYELGLYEKSMPKDLPWVDKLAIAGESGFDFLEISIDESDEKLFRLDWEERQRRDILNAQLDAGIPIRTMCLSGHRKYPLGSATKEIRHRSLDIMRKAIEFACATGIRIIQVAGYDVYYEEHSADTEKLFSENLIACVEMAARKGVMLAFETMETPFMDTTQKAMRYVESIQSPYLQVYPDIGNLSNAALIYGIDVIEDLACAKGHIAALHLKETRPGIYREVKMGSGHVDFAACIRSAAAQGARIFVGEMWYTGNDDWREEIKRSAAFLRGKLREGFSRNAGQH